MKKMETLILLPELNRLHGIVLHYKGLQKYWNHDVEYFEIPKRKGIKHYISLLLNIIKYTLNLLTRRYSTIVFNTSLKAGFYTQILHFIIAKLLFYKTIVFIHGWDINSENILDKKLARFFLQKTNAIIVLADSFKNKLNNAGIKTPVYVSCTKVDDELLGDFNIENKDIKEEFRFLYVSRIEKEKGILLSIDIFRELKKIFPKYTLHIVGDGSYMDNVKSYIDGNDDGITICGRLEEKKLSDEYKNADFFFLQSESEGLPAALLEAMAFGLVPIVTPVGAIPEFFIDNVMGIMSNSRNIDFYIKRITSLSEVNIREISKYNYNYAQKHFLASRVAKSLEDVFKQTIE